MRESGKRLVVLRRALSLLQPGEFRVVARPCPMCGFPLLLRLGDQEHAVRCPRCRGGVAHLSMASVIADECPDLPRLDVYEMSSRGALVRFLSRNAQSLTCSEYFPDTPGGEYRDGVVCQDVQALTFPDACFDLCTSTDVFEHVADPMTGWRELLRVLRPGGKLIFTVPLSDQAETVERAVLVDGEIRHLLPPEYHNDHLRGSGEVLAFRNFGLDIVASLHNAGFENARVNTAFTTQWFGHGRPVIVASRPSA